MKVRVQVGLLFLTLLATLSAAHATASAQPLIRCDYLSSTPRSDGKALVACLARTATAWETSLSTDSGRSWTSLASAGLPNVDPVLGIVASDTGAVVGVQFQSLGLFLSTDRGASFLLADVQAGNVRGDRISYVSSFGASTPGLPAEPALAIPGSRAAVFYRGQHVPVLGSGNASERAFIEFGLGANSVVVNVSDDNSPSVGTTTRISRCDRVLTCQSGFSLPKGLDLIFASSEQGAAARTALLVLYVKGSGDTDLWATTDRGGTARKVAGYEALRRAISPKGGQLFRVRVAAVTSTAWFIQLEQKLAVSTDQGRTWRQVPAPWLAKLVGGPGGQVFAIDNDADRHFRCSTDRGRHWNPRC